jgi:hypothetical protein
VDNGIQLPDLRGPLGIWAEGSFGEFRAVDGAVGIQDGAAEVAHDFFINRLAGLHEFVGNVIGMDEARATRHEHFADHGFTAGDPAG